MIHFIYNVYIQLHDFLELKRLIPTLFGKTQWTKKLVWGHCFMQKVNKTQKRKTNISISIRIFSEKFRKSLIVLGIEYSTSVGQTRSNSFQEVLL